MYLGKRIDLALDPGWFLASTVQQTTVQYTTIMTPAKKKKKDQL